MIDQLVFARLQDRCADLVGGAQGGFDSGFDPGFDVGGGGRIYPVVPPVDVDQLPYLVYTVGGMEREAYLSGASDLARYTVSVDCWAVTHAESRDLALAVEGALRDWRSGRVLFSRITQASNVPEEAGFHYQLEFAITARDT